MEIAFVPVAAVPAGFATVQEIVTEAPDPAVKVTEFVPCPAVMVPVPAVIDQLKLDPACAGTLADALVLAVTDAGAEIVAFGAAYTWIVDVLDAVDPAPLVTVTDNVMGSVLPAANWMPFVPAPLVMVPPVMLHAYVADVCAGTLAGTAVAPAVTAVATLTDAFGAA